MESNELSKFLKTLVSNGYTCYVVKDCDYGYIITPSDNVLYIQHNDDFLGGWSIVLEYKPSRSCGSGCQCHKERIYELSVECIKQSEQYGLQFARSLFGQEIRKHYCHYCGQPIYSDEQIPRFYNNSSEWLVNYWGKEGLVLVQA